MKGMKIADITFSLITAIAVVIILIYGKNLLIPLVLAIMIWFIIKAVRDFCRQWKRLEKLPVWTLNIFSFLIISAVLAGVVKLLSGNISEMSKALPAYEKNIGVMVSDLGQFLGVDLEQTIGKYAGDLDLAGVIRALVNSISDILANTFLIVIYIVFLLIEESVFPRKLHAIFSGRKDYESVRELLGKIDRSMNHYIALKTLVSFLTGLFSYIALRFLSVDFAFFWAVIIFLFNFVPTIGSLIGTLFPALIAVLQSGEPETGLWVLLVVGAIQMVIGNFVEPRMMGNSLNISSLVVLLSLAFWGSIWGVVGMLLSVPITVMLIILFAQLPNTRPIAILLSANGHLLNEDD